MAAAKARRSRQAQIRVVPVFRKEIDMEKLARVVLDLAKQQVAEQREQERLATPRPHRVRHAATLHKRRPVP
jgi:hypothetical protein